MRKRILAVVLSVCMVLSSAPVNVQATEFTTKVAEETTVEVTTEETSVDATTETTEETIVETTTETTEESTEAPSKQEREEIQTVGNKVTVGTSEVEYTLDGSNKATITGVKCTGGTLDLSNGIDGYEIVAIDDGWDDYTAFSSCNVHSVVLPNTIKTIEDYAFADCKYLTSINIPEGVTSLGECVLSGCTSLTTVTLPSTLASIGSLTFQELGNTKAVTLVIPESVTSIEEDAFKYCSYLTLKVHSGSYAETWCKSVYGTANHSSYYGWKYTVMNGSTIDISGATYSGVNAQYTYTGGVIQPVPTVVVNGTTLIKDTDYTLTYSAVPMNVGNYTITVTGKGNYEGSFNINYSIVATGINNATISKLDGAAYTGAVLEKIYTGSAITPSVELTFNGIPLEEGLHYQLEYNDNVNVGTATITITGINCFNSERTVSFKIVEPTKSIADATCSTIGTQTYTGSAIEPAFSLTYDGSTLTKGTDYTVEYSNNIDVGTATITITGKGNYEGTYSKEFTITPKSLADANVSGETVMYTGSAVTTKPTVVLDGKTLTYGTDYTATFSNNINVGTATITITGKGNYTGTATGSYTISQKTFNGATLSTISDQTYTGSEICPKVSVSLDGEELSGDEYEITYSDNITVGTATVTITGKGAYAGEKKTTFKIVPANIENATITVDDGVYSGNAVEPSVKVVWNEKTLVEGTDYTVAYENNVKVSQSATVTITGINNFEGEVSKTFTISAASIEEAVIGAIADYTYTGSAIVPEPTVSLNGVTLSKDRDYTITCDNNTNAGTATVTITGMGNYEGTCTEEFTIKPKSLAKANVSGETVIYTGSAVTTTPTVVLDGKTLILGTDYTATFSNNVNVGTATITITGKGNYTGTATGSYTISQKTFDGVTLSTISDQTYTGSEICPKVSVSLDGEELSGDEYEITYSDNIAVGTATVTITGKGAYAGEKKTTFKIVPANIEKATITVDDGVYSGNAVEPSVKVVWNKKTLVEGTDYTVAYENNIKVSQSATVTITGINNFEGEVSKTFTISAASLEDAVIGAIADCTYTGSAIVPEPTVSLNGVTLLKDRDYTITYSNNTNAGTATVTITGMGGYEGTCSKQFTIEQKSLSAAAVTGETVVYTGSAVTTVTTVILDGKVLVYNTDYTATFSNNVNVGTATITITGKGNYKGTATGSYTISHKSLGAATISVIANQTYTGSKICPEVSVSLDGEVLSSDAYDVTYGNNINVGTAIVTITGKGSYSGEIKTNFKVVAEDINKAVVVVNDDIYTGSAVEPSLTVVWNGVNLVKGTDYTVTYNNNIDASETASVTVTGINNFAGQVTKNFSIVAASIKEATIETIPDYTYDDGNEIKPEPTVELNGTTLRKDVDYTLSYSDNINVGTATVTVTGKGNYTGSVGATFKIVEKPVVTISIEGAEVSGLSGMIYTGSEIKPEPVVKVNGTTLTKGTDYTVTYTDNINVGTATVVIKGNGTYVGTVAKTFAIEAREIETAEISAISNQIYTGSEMKPSVAVTLDGITLVSDTDYTVTYSDNVDAGTATVTVTGKGNYTGTVTGRFTISPKSVDTMIISSINNQTYTGNAINPSFTVSIDGKELSSDLYTVVYSDNVNVGTATITVIGKGNYTGEKKTTFTIVAESIEKAVVAVNDGVYTGNAVEPSLVVMWNNVTLVKGTDYTVDYDNNVNASQSATAIITGINNFAGETIKTFTINAASIKEAVVEAIPNYTYDDGNAIKPEPTIELNGVTLLKDIDYTLTYSNNINVGTATVTVTGKGNYNGSVGTTFKIVEKPVVTIPLEGAEISGLSAMVYTGFDLKPEPVVKVNGSILTKGTDYTLTYSNNVNVGTATVTIKGNGSYTGSVMASFVISEKSIGEAEIGAISNYTYTGSEIKPYISVAVDGKTLIKGTDYTVVYSNNINVGTATVMIAGMGNYTGTIVGEFTIDAKSIASASLSSIVNQIYTGSEITPLVTVTLDNKTLTTDDYTITYSDNINVGTATVTVTGKGNYTGSTSTYFSILDATSVKSIDNAVISTIADVVYTGNVHTPEPTVTLYGTTLVKDKDYILGWADNKNAGTATVTITGIGDYVGIITTTFTIAKKSITSGTVSGIVNKTYTGSATTQNITLKVGTKTLTKGVSYTVSYKKNVNAGTATMTITGKGNYTGTITKTYTIAKKSIASGTVSGLANKTYTGSATTQKITLKLKVGSKTKTLTKGVSYTVSYSNNINAGTATVIIKGKGNYTGTIKKTYKIYPANIAKILTNSFPNVYYKGSAYTPSVKVKLGNKYLTQNKDFTVTYSNNTNVGQAYVIITGKGNYTGRVYKYFLIYPKTTRIGVAAGGYRAFQVKWYATPQVSGYHVQYSLRSDFKTSANAYVARNYNYKTVSGLQSRKYYYVRVRTYANVKVNGKYVRLWSGWSPAVRVATR